MLTRREFLATVPAMAVAPRLAAAEDRVPVVDTHLHCFAGTDSAKFPYHNDAPYKPDDAATPEHLLACMKEAGVDFKPQTKPEEAKKAEPEAK